MSDTLQDRVVRLISGSAHALLDRVEGLAPEATLAQAIREIDQVIAEVRTEFGRIEAARHQVATRLAKLAGEHEDLAAKAELAIHEGRDDLAAASLERQTLIEDQMPVLQQNLAEHGERAVQCESYLRALLARKQEREAILAEFIAAQRDAARPSNASADAVDHEGRVSRAESAFDRVVARQTGIVNLATAPGDAMKLRELAELQRRRRIEERLLALKAQMADRATS